MEPNFSYEVLKTADGSPTVRLWKDDQIAECMHHSQGALSESIYIYYHALETAHSLGLPIHVLSIGTGLGYNEMLTAAFAIKHDIPVNDVWLSTYESEDFIRMEFSKWLSDESGTWTHLYDEVAMEISRQLDVCPVDIKAFLQNIDLKPALTTSTTFKHKYSVIFFDFFSAKATPEAWTPEAISYFLEEAADKKCVLSTYAAKGELRRGLQEAGFDVQKRPGYSGKRDCTLAIKK